MRISERATDELPSPDQIMLLRKITEFALWHLPPKEPTHLMRQMKIEALKHPHPGDESRKANEGNQLDVAGELAVTLCQITRIKAAS
jgi:hypothetical protein